MKIHGIFCSALAAFTCGLISFSAPNLVAKSIAPKPQLVSSTWHLNFAFNKPQRLTVIAGRGTSAHVITCYYMRYSVVNATGKDIFFVPRFTMITDTGRLIRATVDITPKIFASVRRLTGDPFLINPMLIAGRLLQGQDNAKDSVAVFMGLTHKDRGFRIFVSGLSGETAIQLDPLTNKAAVLHKTLVLHYSIPGEAINTVPDPILVSKKWVMR